MHSFPQTRRRSATDACRWLPRANRSLHGRFSSLRSRIPAKVCCSVPVALLSRDHWSGKKHVYESTAGLDSTQTLCAAMRDKELVCVSSNVGPPRLFLCRLVSPRRPGRTGQSQTEAKSEAGRGLGVRCGLLGQSVIRHGAVDYDDSPDGGEGRGEQGGTVKGHATQHGSVGRQ